jgi:hypothetical protein
MNKAVKALDIWCRKLRTFTLLAFGSLIVCGGATFSAIQRQLLDNQFGPEGIQSQSRKPHFDLLDFMGCMTL